MAITALLPTREQNQSAPLLPHDSEGEDCRNDGDTSSLQRKMEGTITSTPSLLVVQVGMDDYPDMNSTTHAKHEREHDDQDSVVVGYPYKATDTAGVFRPRPTMMSVSEEESSIEIDERHHHHISSSHNLSVANNTTTTKNRGCITPLLQGEHQHRHSNVMNAYHPPSLVHRISTTSVTSPCRRNSAIHRHQQSQVLQDQSPVSVAHVTELHNHHHQHHHDHNDESSSPPFLPSLPETTSSPVASLSTVSPIAPSRPRVSLQLPADRKRSLASAMPDLDDDTTTESRALAPRWHELKRPKTEDSSEEDDSTMSLVPSSESHVGWDATAKSASQQQHNLHHPSLLEIAVGYGFHLARVRLQREQNHCELDGILDPSHSVHDIVEDGAKTVGRMKEEERRLFWKYMDQSLPLLQQQQPPQQTTIEDDEEPESP